MVLHQLSKEGIVLVCHQIIKADAGAYKDLLYPGKGTELS
jgi:hypothetical protein